MVCYCGRTEIIGNPVPQPDYVSSCHIPFKQWLEKRAGDDTYSRHLVETIKADPGGDIANVRIDLTDFKDQNPDILPFTGLKINYLKDNQIISTTGDLPHVTGSATPNQKAPIVEVHTWNRSGHTQYHISYDKVSYVPDSTDGRKTLQFDNSKNELIFEKSDQWSSAFLHLASDYKIFDINLENFETDPAYIELKNAKAILIKKDTSVPHVTNYIIMYQPENVDIDSMLL